MTRRVWRAQAWMLGLSLVFGVLFYWNAYVSDDAFIAFRTADNFVRGEGLRWNVEERVQSFTSPAFTFLVSAIYWLVYDPSPTPNPGRIYWVALALSFVLSLAALLRLAWSEPDRTWFWPVFALLMGSQAFVTFTSSGLETPLLYFLLVAFYTSFLRWSEAATPSKYFATLLLATMALLTRLDALLLLLPACGWLVIRGWREHHVGILWPVGLALLPLALWTVFSIVYFGFPLPNTYYAKLGLDVERGVLLRMGLTYLRAGFLQDPITLLTVAAGIGISWSDPRARLGATGSLLFVAYVVWIGGDFLGFRFLAAPFLISAMMILRCLPRRVPEPHRRWAAAGVVAAVAYSVVIPASPLRAFRDPPRAYDVAFYYPASGLANWRPAQRFPFARFLFVEDERHCKALRARAFVVAIWGDGLNGFCRGPDSHLIDGHGITDALMARLPSGIRQPFMPGHLAKPIPAGYVESIVAQQNHIEDPDLALYYDKVREIVSGPLFSRERWRYIAELNLTADRHYRKPYLALSSIPAWMRHEAGRR